MKQEVTLYISESGDNTEVKPQAVICENDIDFYSRGGHGTVTLKCEIADHKHSIVEMTTRSDDSFTINVL